METPVSPKISWKLQVVLRWGQRQVVLYPKGSNICKKPCEKKAFGLVETLWS